MASSARQYHNETSYDRFDMQGGYMDWGNQPTLYKTYPDINPISLPEPSAVPEVSLWDIAGKPSDKPSPSPLHLQHLAQILSVAYSFTAQSRHGRQVFYYRSAASAGALYPAELYVGAHHIEDLTPGIYHYNIGDFALAPLREGQFEQDVADMIIPPGSPHCSASLFISGIFFRSAWKYRKRALRYVLLDAGHLLENVILALRALGLNYSYHYDFDDDKANHLLGFDPRQEACLVAIQVYAHRSFETSHPQNIAPLSREMMAASQMAPHEIVYEEIQQMQTVCGTVVEPQKRYLELRKHLGLSSPQWFTLEPDDSGENELAFPQAMVQRRSKRNYIATQSSYQRFYKMLDLLCKTMSQDAQAATPYHDAITVGYLAGDIEKVTSGFYLLDPVKKRYGLIGKGTFISPMTAACLNQEWLSNAALHFLFMTNLEKIDQMWGARGYRYGMLTAGRLGQSIYLGATALVGLGSCGIGALYDGEARDILGLNQESCLLYLVAAGPVKRL